MPALDVLVASRLEKRMDDFPAADVAKDEKMCFDTSHEASQLATQLPEGSLNEMKARLEVLNHLMCFGVHVKTVGASKTKQQHNTTQNTTLTNTTQNKTK